jgi:hypothetical protein
MEAVFEAKGYKKACIKRYNHTWYHLQKFMAAQSEEYYNPDLGQPFLDDRHTGKQFNELTHRQQERVRHIEVLTDMLLTDTLRENRHVNKVYVFEGNDGEPFRDFILTHADVNLDDGTLMLRECKNGQDRLIALSHPMREICRDYLDYTRNVGLQCLPEDRFFTVTDGKSCISGSIYEIFRTVVYHVGLPHGGRSKGPRLHDLRHTFRVNSPVKMTDEGWISMLQCLC